MTAALDTNILAYAEGVGDECRCESARSLIERLPVGQVVLPAQTLGGLYRVLTGKAGFNVNDARLALLSWADAFNTVDSRWTAFLTAFDIAADHGLQIWDSVILSVAAQNHCRLLVSEDFQDGFMWGGTTVVNPFVGVRSRLLENFLRRR